MSANEVLTNWVDHDSLLLMTSCSQLIRTAQTCDWDALTELPWFTLLLGAPKSKTVTDKLQRVLNAAARVVSDTRKFDRGLTSLLNDELHWLDVPERVTGTYKMGVMVYRCLHGQAPRYGTSVADHLITSSDIASRLRLRSANRHQLIVPRCRLNTYGRPPFSIAGPTVWNSLPDELRAPACGSNSFKQFLKTILFSLY